MDFFAVLDVSAFIWDERHYSTNEYEYLKLAENLSKLISEFSTEKPKILLRTSFLQEIMASFPYGKMLPYSIENQILTFLSNSTNSFITYPKNDDNVICSPDLARDYYSESILNEIKYLASRVHAEHKFSNVYFTFVSLWQENEVHFTTSIGDTRKEHEVIVCDKKIEDNDMLSNFFVRFKLIFEHNPKHDPTPYNSKEMWEQSDDKEGFISRLSCYNRNDSDNTLAQSLLETAYKFKNRYYNYDEQNEVWVVFQAHEEHNNKYHGYDEYNEDSPAKIPNEVKKNIKK